MLSFQLIWRLCLNIVYFNCKVSPSDTIWTTQCPQMYKDLWSTNAWYLISETFFGDRLFARLFVKIAKKVYEDVAQVQFSREPKRWFKFLPLTLSDLNRSVEKEKESKAEVSFAQLSLWVEQKSQWVSWPSSRPSFSTALSLQPWALTMGSIFSTATWEETRHVVAALSTSSGVLLCLVFYFLLRSPLFSWGTAKLPQSFQTDSIIV